MRIRCGCVVTRHRQLISQNEMGVTRTIAGAPMEHVISRQPERVTFSSESILSCDSALRSRQSHRDRQLILMPRCLISLPYFS